MQNFSRTLSGMALAIGLGVALIGGSVHFAQASSPQDTPAKKDKNYKDTAEYDAYNEVIKASNPPDPKKMLAALDAWSQKYPTTDYKDERSYYYMQAYAGTNQPGKVLDTAKELIAGGLPGLKAALTVPQYDLQTLYLASANAAALAATGSPTPDQLDTGLKAAQMLQEYGKEYFAADKKPAGTPADQWAQGLKLVDDTAQGAMFQIAIFPGNAIYKKGGQESKDPATCAQAESEYRKALGKYPESGQLAAILARVSVCQQGASPEKVQHALFQFARAVSLPVGGPAGLDAAGQKALDDYLKRIYTNFHGGEDGLAELKASAAKTPTAPADFKIKSKTEIAHEKEEEFRTKNPQLAMWMGLKASLADTNGAQYFESSMKDADIKGEGGTRALKGVLVGMETKGKATTCRPDELLVAIPLPDATGAPVAEIKLKLDAALTGAPETGTEIAWDGVPVAFTKEPFMLTMESEKGKIDGLKMTACAAPAGRKGAPAAAPPATKGGAGTTTTPPPTKKK